MRSSSKRRILAACVSGFLATCAFAQYGRPNMTKGVGIEQKLQSQVPEDLTFRDEQNRSVFLHSYFGDVPVVLAMVYYRCPNTCDMTLNELVSSLKRVPLKAGTEYNVVIVSIDPSETPQLASEKKANYKKVFERQNPNDGFDGGFHFLTGSQDAIARLGNAIGFHYRWDEPSHQFVHAAGVMVATPEGKMSRYFFGVQYAPQDMRLALAEASQGHIQSPVNAILLFCFHYDTTQGKYTLAIFNLLKVAGTLTVLALGALIYFLNRKYKAGTTEEPHWREAQHVR